MRPCQERTPKQPSDDDGKREPLGEACSPIPLSYASPQSDPTSGPSNSIHAVARRSSEGDYPAAVAIDITRSWSNLIRQIIRLKAYHQQVHADVQNVGDPKRCVDACQAEGLARVCTVEVRGKKTEPRTRDLPLAPRAAPGSVRIGSLSQQAAEPDSAGGRRAVHRHTA